jgi:hypothetical protein
LSILKNLLGDQTELARTIVLGLLILMLLVGVLLLVYRAKSSLNPIEYEGRIVDKWAGYNHSDEGSFPYFRLLLETDKGQKLTVAVDREDYERAKIGMRIKKTRQGIELTHIEPESRSGPPITAASNGILSRPS